MHSFNTLDGILNSHICELINDRTDRPGATVIYNMGFSEKVALFNRLGKLFENIYESTIPSFNSLINELKECARLRNVVVHADWEAMTTDGYTYVKLKFVKNQMQHYYIQFTPESLELIEDLIHKTCLKFDTFREEKDYILTKNPK